MGGGVRAARSKLSGDRLRDFENFLMTQDTCKLTKTMEAWATVGNTKPRLPFGKDPRALWSPLAESRGPSAHCTATPTPLRCLL